MNQHPQAAQLRLVHSQAQAQRFERPQRWSVTATTNKGSISYTATGTRSEVWDAALESWGADARLSIRPQERA